jgi:hypothetical protein
MEVTKTQNLQPIYFIHLIIQLSLVLRTYTPLQVHQENVTSSHPTKVTTRDIAMDKPSIVNASESCLHLPAGRLLRRQECHHQQVEEQGAGESHTVEAFSYTEIIEKKRNINPIVSM